MKGAMILWAAALAAASPAAGAERYKIHEEGGFGTTGRFIEFADRYGWDSYVVDFDFGVDLPGRALESGSTLEISVQRKDGGRWRYRCVAHKPGSGRAEMWANVNQVYGRGLSVMTECRVPPRKFARAVDVNAELVGEPTFVFHVVIQDGKAVPGAQKGFYFLSAAEVPGGPLAPYATAADDPSQLGVVFTAQEPPVAFNLPGGLTQTARFVP